MSRFTILSFVFLFSMVSRVSAVEQVNSLYSFRNDQAVLTKNSGQWDSRILYVAQSDGLNVFLTTEGAFFQQLRFPDKNEGGQRHPSLPERSPMAESQNIMCEQLSVKMTFVGCDQPKNFEGEGTPVSSTNYFLRDDPWRWQKRVPGYTSVVAKDVYPGIDLRFYSNGDGGLEYDLIVAPGADYHLISIQYDGVESIELDPDGGLKLKTSWDTISKLAPVIYQESNGRRLSLSGAYLVHSGNTVKFELRENYDKSLPLVIDPAIVYSTFLGGTNYEIGMAIAAGNDGSAYVTGRTVSPDFPSADSILSAPWNPEIFITKIVPEGGAIAYSTVLGGSDNDESYAIAVDSEGCAMVCGYTMSSDFPAVSSLQTNIGYSDGILLKLSPEGDSIIFSTFIGGSSWNELLDITLSSNGAINVCGRTNSIDLPTVNPYQGSLSGGPENDFFVMRLTSNASAILYSTYLGGSDTEWAVRIALDQYDRIVIAGTTESFDFPAKKPIQSYSNWSDVVVTKFGGAGDSLIFSTYLGGSSGDDAVHGLAVDTNGCSYIAGMTNSSGFPLKNQIQPKYPGDDAFLTKISEFGDSLIYSTPLGGHGADEAYGLELSGESAVVSGFTQSTDFPTKDSYQGTQPGPVFITKFSPTGQELEYSTLIGSGWHQAFGSDVDANGNVYVTGHSASRNYPLINPIQQFGGEYDAFVTKLRQDFLCGDVNADHTVVLTDIIYLINYVFGAGAQPNPIVAGDADCNGIVTISDAVYLINYTFSGGDVPCAACL